RFIATDTIGSLVEAAIDDFRVSALMCPPPCRVDINGDGLVTVGDFLEYLQLYSGGGTQADFNGDGRVDVQDFLAFPSAYRGGCWGSGGWDACRGYSTR